MQIIRQQRHLGTRVVIATQEPTISPKLLDLCNVAFVHQFGSPAWYSVLKNHLAALGLLGQGSDQVKDQVMKMIVKLKRGEALVFCPKACLGFGEVVKVNEEGARVDAKIIRDESETANESPVDSQISSDVPRIDETSRTQGKWDAFNLLEDAFIKLKVRPKLTADGGKSIVASVGT